MNRRDFLTALGLGGSGLLLPSLFARRSEGDTPAGTCPTRLIIFHTWHGTNYPDYRMWQRGIDERTDGSYSLADVEAGQFSPILRPLHRYRDRVAIFDGLALVSADGDGIGDQHQRGQVHSLTGGNVQVVGGDNTAGGPSIDQVVAQRVARPDRFPSLELAVGGDYLEGSYADTALPLPFEANTEAMARRVFGGAVSTPTTQLDAIQGELLRRSDEQYMQLASELDPTSAARLTEHGDRIRELVVRLEGIRDATCAMPTLSGRDAFESYGNAFLDTLAVTTAALACDLTRVVTLAMGQIPAEDVGLPPGDIHFDYAHQVYETDEGSAAMTRYFTAQTQQLVDLMAALEAVPEGDGTLLDHTVILCTTELGAANHTFDRWPCIMAGGAPGLRLGSYHRFLENTPAPSSADVRMGRPHQAALVEAARACGVNLDSIGLSEIAAADGTLVDMRGGLGLVG
ncbi:MAG: DUF1552 domain-containing protein [Myxococcota bacterium]